MKKKLYQSPTVEDLSLETEDTITASPVTSTLNQSVEGSFETWSEDWE